MSFRSRTLFATLLAAIAAIACSTSAEKSGSSVAVSEGSASDAVKLSIGAAPAAPMPASPADGAASDERAQRQAVPVTAVLMQQGGFGAQRPVDLLAQSMIVRTGSASIRVDSLATGLAQVRALATRVGGYIGNTQVAAQGGAAPQATLELRVPSARFDEAVAGIESIGFTEGVQVSAEDVGEQYVDLEARLANSRRLELRLIELLASRTGKLSDVLQVEEKLGQIRGEIEGIEGRMRWLRSRASVSTIAVTVHEPYPLVSPSGTPAELAAAFRRAWQNFIAFIAGLIGASGVIVPVAAMAAGAWVAWRRHSHRVARVATE